MSPSKDVFESLVRPDGRLAGVYEQDSETAYFYLYDLEKPEGQKIVAAIQLHAVGALSESHGIDLVWDKSGAVVALFVKGALSAAFSERGDKWQAELFAEDVDQKAPAWVRQAFASQRFH